MKTSRMLAAPTIVVFAATLLAGCGDTKDASPDEPAMSEDVMMSEEPAMSEDAMMTEEPAMSEDAMMTEDAMMEDEG